MMKGFMCWTLAISINYANNIYSEGLTHFIALWLADTEMEFTVFLERVFATANTLSIG